MKETIQCKYTCRACGLYRVVVTVPAREQESVTDWLENTGNLLARDHAQKSPHCCPETFSEVLIPIKNEQTGVEATQIEGALK